VVDRTPNALLLSPPVPCERRPAVDNVVHRRQSDQAPDSTCASVVLGAGIALEPGGVYLDLARPGRGPFVALPGQVAGSGDRYVARRDVPCACWRGLLEGTVRHLDAHIPHRELSIPPEGTAAAGRVGTVAEAIAAP
jgi:hypothetical protein